MGNHFVPERSRSLLMAALLPPEEVGSRAEPHALGLKTHDTHLPTRDVRQKRHISQLWEIRVSEVAF
jgi:hypothetical protein